MNQVIKNLMNEPFTIPIPEVENGGTVIIRLKRGGNVIIKKEKQNGKIQDNTKKV